MAGSSASWPWPRARSCTTSARPIGPVPPRRKRARRCGGGPSQDFSTMRRRFFVDRINGGMADLDGDDARHLTRVLRAEAGQQYEISDNQTAYLAEIVEARGGRVVFRVVQPLDSPPPPVRITLCPALIKFDRFEWMV